MKLTKTQKISIFLTILLLCASLFFDTRTSSIIAFLLILSLGILHGANDIQIIRKVQSNTNSFLKVLVLYLLVVMIAGLLFFFIPKIGLAIFLMISAYHFGEQQFHSMESKYPGINFVFCGMYGLAIIFMLLYNSSELSSNVIYDISAVNITREHFFLVTVISLIVVLILGLFLVIRGQLNNWIKELLLLLLFFVMFRYTSLIFGFALYFVIWHSLPSLLDQVKFIGGSVNGANIWNYIKSSALYWVMSLIGLSFFVYVFKDNEQLFLSLFFTFLAAITFPHVIVMHHLFKDEGAEH